MSGRQCRDFYDSLRKTVVPSPENLCSLSQVNVFHPFRTRCVDDTITPSSTVYLYPCWGPLVRSVFDSWSYEWTVVVKCLTWNSDYECKDV